MDFVTSPTAADWRAAYRARKGGRFFIREERTDGTFWVVASFHGWHLPAPDALNVGSVLAGPIDTLEEAIITASLLGVWE